MASAQKYSVVIYGSFAKSYHKALHPHSRVWDGIENIVDVKTIPDDRDAKLPQHPDADVITVVIPLSVENSINAPKEFHSLIGDAAALNTLHNKNLFAAFVNENNLNKYFPETFSDIDNINYPCVLKRTNLADGAGIIVIPSESALRLALKHPLWERQNIIIQSFIPGSKEYVTHAICLNGKVIWNCTFLYKMKDANPMRKVASSHVFHEAATSPKIIKVIESVIGLLDYSGPINVDYKILNNSPIIFEINPRFGASLMKERSIPYLRAALIALLRASLNRKHK